MIIFVVVVYWTYLLIGFYVFVLFLSVLVIAITCGRLSWPTDQLLGAR